MVALEHTSMHMLERTLRRWSVHTCTHITHATLDLYDHHVLSKFVAAWPCSAQGRRWFDNLRKVFADNSVELIPQGDMCFDCGVAATEGYPENDPEALAARYHSQRNFQLQFDKARERPAKVEPRDFDDEVATKAHDHCMEVYLKLCFVLEAIFTARYSPPALLGIKLDSIPNPEGGADLTGFFCHKHQLPLDIPHYTVKISTRSGLTLLNTVLSADRVAYKQHAKTVQRHEVAKAIASRPSRTKAANVKHVYNFPDLVQKYDAHQAKLAEAQAARDAEDELLDAEQGWGTDNQVVVQRVRGRQEQDDEEEEQAQPRKGKGRGGRGKSRSSKGGKGGSSNRAGSAPASVRGGLLNAARAGTLVPSRARSSASGAAEDDNSVNSSCILSLDGGAETDLGSIAGDGDEDDDNFDLQEILSGANLGREVRGAAPIVIMFHCTVAPPILHYHCPPTQ